MFLLIVLACCLHETIADCPEGWEQSTTNKQKCFKGFRNATTWFDARRICQDQYTAAYTGSLVSIHNVFENAQIATVALRTFSACHYWIGLHDFDENEDYNWADESKLDYTLWAPGSPPSDAAATAIYMSLDDRNQWFATEGTVEYNCFVCQLLPANCPNGWQRFGDSNNRCIKAFDERMSWPSAYSFCEINNGDLVSIYSALENFHAGALAAEKYFYCQYWIGLNDIASMGQYTWVDGSPFNYSDWATGNPPEDIEGSVVYMNLQVHQRWMATGSFAEEKCFVCEKTIN